MRVKNKIKMIELNYKGNYFENESYLTEKVLINFPCVEKVNGKNRDEINALIDYQSSTKQLRARTVQRDSLPVEEVYIKPQHHTQESSEEKTDLPRHPTQ